MYGKDVRRPKLSFEGEKSRTHQSFKDQCDINHIMAKYRKTGLLAHVAKFQGRYEDVSSGMEYRDAVETVMRGNEAFNSLTAELRHKFHNDPAEFLAFVSNPENAEEMRKLGLMKPVQAAPEPVAVRVVQEPAPAGQQGGTSEK